MMKLASWNLNSVKSRLNHVLMWLKASEPDVLLLQELKGTEFPFGAFQSLGYEGVAEPTVSQSGKSGHDAPEWVVTFARNRWSPCSGMGGHDAPEWVVTLARNTHTCL